MKSSVQRMGTWRVAPGRVLDTGFLNKHLKNQIQQKQKGWFQFNFISNNEVHRKMKKRKLQVNKTRKTVIKLFSFIFIYWLKFVFI